MSYKYSSVRLGLIIFSVAILSLSLYNAFADNKFFFFQKCLAEFTGILMLPSDALVVAVVKFDWPLSLLSMLFWTRFLKGVLHARQQTSAL